MTPPRPAPARGSRPGLAELERLAGEWDALADRAAASPFLRPGWVAAWWRAFGKGRLDLLQARESEHLSAVLPIVARAGAIMSPSNWHTPVYGPLAEADHAASEVADRLFARRPALVRLRFLAGNLAPLASAAESAGYGIEVRTLSRFPAIAIGGDFAAYQASLSRNLRGDLARCRRRLEALGPVTLEVRTDAERLPEALAIERAGWKGAQGTAIASTPQTAQFYSQVAQWAAARGSLRLIFLRVEGRPVAFHLAIEAARAYVPLKGGFDPGYHACSPGKLIIHATLERAFASGVERYELLGEEAYKWRWANTSSEREELTAFAPTAAGRVARMAFERGRPLAERAVATLRSRPSR